MGKGSVEAWLSRGAARSSSGHGPRLSEPQRIQTEKSIVSSRTVHGYRTRGGPERRGPHVNRRCRQPSIRFYPLNESEAIEITLNCKRIRFSFGQTG